MSGVDRGCCRHCIEGCTGVSRMWQHAGQEQPSYDEQPAAYAVWQTGQCPMCAEADRIADAIESEAAAKAASYEGLTPAAEFGYRDAARIARGDA